MKQSETERLQLLHSMHHDHDDDVVVAGSESTPRIQLRPVLVVRYVLNGVWEN